MVIDSSALLAILLGEPETHSFSKAIANDPKRLVSVVSALEAAIVIEAKKGPAGGRELDLLLHEASMDLVGMDVEQLKIARRAYQKFGKGLHPAGLNFGDCCSYALSRCSGEALLFKGNDFSKTDAVDALSFLPKE